MPFGPREMHIVHGPDQLRTPPTRGIAMPTLTHKQRTGSTNTNIIHDRRARSTGTRTTAKMLARGGYRVACPHKRTMDAETQSEALSLARHPEKWCAQCRNAGAKLHA